MKIEQIGKTLVYNGDCLDVMDTMKIMGIQVDSIVTDPPYHLTSTVKRFGKEGSAPAQFGTDGAFARASRGFMGKEWDGGDIAFDPETWRRCYDLLKPGGHMLAFSGSRTYHRMVCAIEDAGFEIRDQIMWIYGTGFPKSHDVSKAIDKAAPRVGMFDDFAAHFAAQRKKSGKTQKEIAVNFPSKSGGLTGCVWNWENGANVPTYKQWSILQPLLNLSLEWSPLIERIEAEREIIARQEGTLLAVAPGQGEDRGAVTLDITAPATPEAQRWEGWGTALKPAHEPIVLARKPLIGTVAANVLAHGTGAINIDASRVGTTDKLGGGGEKAETAGKFSNEGWRRPWMDDPTASQEFAAKVRDNVAKAEVLGRFPANVIHDGSDEVIEAFGQAQRFFYSAKASKTDRAGSKHPTVKPVALIKYLATMITPPGGIALDPFAGSGTLGAAWDNCILIEREEEYYTDILRRLSTCDE